MTTVFGPIVIGSDVEQALIDTLKRWLPTYLAEMERLTGRGPGELPEIRSYSQSNRFQHLPQDQFPTAIVISPGLADRPHVRGDGTIGAWWRLGVAVICSASTHDASNELAKLYGAAIRTLLVQRPDLGGIASGFELVSEMYDDVPADYLEIGASAQIETDVFVDAIADNTQGPSIPVVDLTQPPPGWPAITEEHIGIQLQEIT